MPAATYYVHDPYAPKPNGPAKFGSAIVIISEEKVLLANRKDNFRWGIISGDLKDTETFRQCAIRRTIEETGIHLKNEELHELKLFDDPSRVVSTHDGQIRRLVDLAYYVLLDQIPQTKCGSSCIELKWVLPSDLNKYEITVTHGEILQKAFEVLHIDDSTMSSSIYER